MFLVLELSLDPRLLALRDQPPLCSLAGSCSAQGCTQIPEGAWRAAASQRRLLELWL